MTIPTPCTVRWTGPKAVLTSPEGAEVATLTPGVEGVLVYPGLVSFHPDLALLYRVDETHIEVIDAPLVIPDPATALGGWDGKTITPALVRGILSLDAAIPTLVAVMNDDDDLGPKIVQGVMAGLGG